MEVRKHCRRGHPFDEENTYVAPKGKRLCRICKKESRRKWEAANSEKRREQRREWNEANPDYQREHNAANRENGSEYTRKWAKDNPEQRLALNRKYNRKRRALKLSQLGLWEDDSFIERQLFIYQNGKCYYCGTRINLLDHKTFHLDHCTPLTREGKHCATNVVLACPPCNQSKATKTAEEFTDDS